MNRPHPPAPPPTPRSWCASRPTQTAPLTCGPASTAPTAATALRTATVGVSGVGACSAAAPGPGAGRHLGLYVSVRALMLVLVPGHGQGQAQCSCGLACHSTRPRACSPPPSHFTPAAARRHLRVLRGGCQRKGGALARTTHGAPAAPRGGARGRDEGAGAGVQVPGAAR